MLRTSFVASRPIAIAVVALCAACSDSTSPSVASGFLGGTNDNHEIGLVINSTGKALTLFQLGSPTTQKQIPLERAAR